MGSHLGEVAASAFPNPPRLRCLVWAAWRCWPSVVANKLVSFHKAPEQSGAFLLLLSVGRSCRSAGGGAPPPHHNPNPVGRNCRSAIRPTNQTPGRAELPPRQRRGTAALPQSKSGRAEAAAPPFVQQIKPPAGRSCRSAGGGAPPPHHNPNPVGRKLLLRHSFNKSNPR